MRPALVPALVGAAAILAGAAPSTLAAEVGVAIPGKYFLPGRVEVVVGDVVTWQNGDFVTHDLVAADGAFDSGLLFPGAGFSASLDQAGVHPYVCTLHAGMVGEVDVVDLQLQAPVSPPATGERFTLRGRAQLASGPVTIERGPGPDGPFEPVATMAAGPDGSFETPVTADATATWRARAGGAISPPVAIPVAPRVDVRLRARRRGPLVVLSVATLPARPNATVTLQLYSREHFIWRRSELARLDQQGRTTFSLTADRPHRVRVVYAAPGAAAPVSSPPLQTRPARRPARHRVGLGHETR